MEQHRLFLNFQASPKINFGSPGSNSPSPQIRVKKISSLVDKSELEKRDRMAFSDLIDGASTSQVILGSDSDSQHESEFFTKCSFKIPYSIEEDEVIIKFVLKGENIFRVGSISLWKHLEYKKDNPKRTYQSLKNRFMRNIKPFLFTTYSHLIRDEETLKKVLAKFPELRKSSIPKKNILSLTKLPKREDKKKSASVKISKEQSLFTPEENGVSSTSPNTATENAAPENGKKTKESGALALNLNLNIFGVGRNHKKVEFKNDSIVVTIDRFIVFPENTTTSSFGIYQKFLRLKKKNKLEPCPQCGRCGSEPDKFEISESDGERDLVISNAVDPFEMVKPIIGKSSSEGDGNQMTTSTLMNKTKESNTNTEESDKEDQPSNNHSPSLLEDVRSEVVKKHKRKRKNRRGVSQTDEGNATRSTKKRGKKLSDSEECSNDQDVNTLVQETVAQCRTFLDSDNYDDDDDDVEEEEETLGNVFKTKSKAFKPNSSVTSDNAESFFLNPNLSSVENKWNRKIKTTRLSPLVANMKKMLK